MTATGLQEVYVADLMAIDPITIHPDASVEDAGRLLRTYRITGLPVVDDEGRPVGVISQTDLLTLETASLSSAIRHRPSGVRVGEVMTFPAITIAMGAPIGAAARLMTEHSVHRLVAIDSAGRAVGVLSATDLVAVVAETISD
jgi:CBS domain-containing protein